MSLDTVLHVNTPCNVEVVQYIRDCSVHRGDNISTVGTASVLWGISSVLWRLFSTVGGLHQYMWGNNISTVGDTSVMWRVFSTVEGYFQYCGGITAVHVGG